MDWWNKLHLELLKADTHQERLNKELDSIWEEMEDYVCVEYNTSDKGTYIIEDCENY